jgi:hypothetical protein
MPLKQLRVVKKIKYLMSSALITKQQIVNKVKKNANDHLVINQRQEKDDIDRIKHATKELRQENETNNKTNPRVITILTISIAINIVFFVIFMIIWYLIN